MAMPLLSRRVTMRTCASPSARFTWPSPPETMPLTEDIAPSMVPELAKACSASQTLSSLTSTQMRPCEEPATPSPPRPTAIRPPVVLPSVG